MDETDVAPAESAFAFTGNWREFAPIAFTNLLLTIVTLGIYRFWATARERRYLWSRTRFIDDRLEWTGTGLELFIGFLLVFALLLGPIVFLQFGLQAMVLRGYTGIAVLITLAVYIFIFYLVGVARFRALRYRLSRTHWHGIRGGADDQGFAYGWSYIWRTTVGYLALGLMVPWSMTTLWNERWRHMSFGPHRFDADAQWNSIFGRYMIFYLSPILLLIVLGILIAVGAVAVGSLGGFNTSGPPQGGALAAIIIAGIAFYLLFFVALGLVAMIYYSAFYREAIGAVTLSTLHFGFTARTKDWIWLFVGNVALVVVTLGIGLIFLRYRNWKFFITHLEAFGEVDLDLLTQSRTREPGQGEGLLDAFDVGAI